jgi:hypothetical protein
MDKFELTEKQLNVIRALETLGYTVTSYHFYKDEDTGIRVYIHIARESCFDDEKRLNITDLNNC